MPHDRGVRPEARELARRVNEVGDGWTAELVRTGGGTSHKGIAYEVKQHGVLVFVEGRRLRFSGNPSYPGLAFTRAEADIRRAGCPLPRKGITPKKEEVMAAPTADEKARSAELRPRLQTVLNDRFNGDYNELIGAAIEMIDSSELEQFGKGKTSSPREIAWNGLTRFLEGGAFKQPNLERWGYVLERMNGAAPGPGGLPPAADEGKVATRLGTEPQPPPEKEDEHLTYEQVIEQLGLERESRRLAEEIVEDVERERDEARSDVAKFQKQLDELETARASLAKRAERLEKDLKAKPEADPEASRKLEETRAQLADALRRGDDLPGRDGRGRRPCEERADRQAASRGRGRASRDAQGDGRRARTLAALAAGRAHRARGSAGVKGNHDHDHALAQDWRLPRITARQTDARQIRDTLEHLDDLVELFSYEKDEATAEQIRSLMGQLKTRASDAEQEAAELEAIVQTREGKGAGSRAT